MEVQIPAGIHDLYSFREQRRVFRDRTHAGEVLADMLTPHVKALDRVLGIPSGGVPVGAATAQRLNLPFDVAVVSKITLPWNTEAGYGAVAFDGTLRLNEALLSRLHLTDSEIRQGIRQTREKVAKRVSDLRGARPLPDLAKACVVLIDDGLASGFTLKTAVDALIHLNPQTLVVAVPTAHRESLDLIRNDVRAVFCPNVRSGMRYAVAEAYENWYDVPETEVMDILKSLSESKDP